MSRSFRILLGVGVLALATAPANAAFTVNATVGGNAIDGANYVNFDDLNTGSSGGSTAYLGTSAQSGSVAVSFTNGATMMGNGQVVQGGVSGQYAPPVFSNGNGSGKFGSEPNGTDMTNYLTSGVVPGTAILDFTGLQSYIGLLWGSVDAYNTLEFFNGNTSVGTVTGSRVTTLPNGSQGPGGTYYANITSTLAFNRVVASSTQFAFEFDNVAIAAVPEPSTAAMAFTGLTVLGLGYVRRSRRKAS